MKQYRNLILILILVAIAIFIDLPNHPGIRVGSYERDIATRLGLDLVGGVQALLEADLAEGQSVDAETMRAATRIVENRVNGLGVEEAIVQQAGEDRIVVEIPGVSDPEEAIATIRETGLLEFVHMGLSPLPEGTVVTTDFSPGTTTGTQPEETDDPAATPDVGQTLHTVMTGEVLRTVQVATDQAGRYVIEFSLTPEGSRTFADYTSQNVGQFLGIVLDKQVISAPRVESAITEGSGIISGSFTLESANALAIQLRYGSLPIPLRVVESRIIGPTLGQDSLQKSLLAGVIGFTVVILFMGLYYRLPGVVADVSIVIYALLAFALFRWIPVTLTLPGIAGLMLSTGSALDANILIFERLKEELRSGRTLRQAVDLGWQRAWPSIRDSNISTLITCGILFWFGSSFGATIVKGFSLTLALGVGVSLFTAIVVTRTLLNLVLSYLKPENYEKWFGL
jgi:preprotein translocase subunit SecD